MTLLQPVLVLPYHSLQRPPQHGTLCKTCQSGHWSVKPGSCSNGARATGSFRQWRCLGRSFLFPLPSIVELCWSWFFVVPWWCDLMASFFEKNFSCKSKSCVDIMVEIPRRFWWWLHGCKLQVSPATYKLQMSYPCIWQWRWDCKPCCVDQMLVGLVPVGSRGFPKEWKTRKRDR